MDEIQYATERDLAIRNLDRDSKLLRQVKAALIRIHAGHFGTCLDCEEATAPNVSPPCHGPSRCIQCQEISDLDRRGGVEATRLSRMPRNPAPAASSPSLEPSRLSATTYPENAV